MTPSRQQPAPPEEFSLVDSIHGAIESRYGYEQLMSWSPDIPIACRVVHCVWSLTGFAACEGYVAFLGLKCPHRQLAYSLREIGLPDLAQLIEQMLAPIPWDGVLGDVEALERHFGGWDNFAAWVRPFESQLFDANDRIVGAEAEYCRAQADSLRHLSPEAEKLLNQLNHR